MSVTPVLVSLLRTRLGSVSVNRSSESYEKTSVLPSTEPVVEWDSPGQRKEHRMTIETKETFENEKDLEVQGTRPPTNLRRGCVPVGVGTCGATEVDHGPVGKHGG